MTDRISRDATNDEVSVTRGQLINWAARIARLAWSAEDDAAHGQAIALAMEMKARADTVFKEVPDVEA